MLELFIDTLAVPKVLAQSDVVVDLDSVHLCTHLTSRSSNIINSKSLPVKDSELIAGS